MLDFDTVDPGVESVRFKGRDYELREAPESVAIAFRKMQFQDARLVDGKVTANMEKIVESQSFLVANCLYDGPKTVPLGEVRTWPSRVIKKLFGRAKAMSDIAEEETEEGLEKEIASLQKKLEKLREGNAAKNSQNATMDTSS